jgi:polysaccharide export outer membrane protein
MKRSIVSILGLILLLSIAIFAQDEIQVANTSGNSYLIKPGDKLVGKVMGEEEFNFEVVIDENGRFELPFVDKVVTAKCRTQSAIKEEVKEHYSKYLRNPLLSVQVTDRRKPAPVTVSGAVRTPQQVELRREARLIELLSFSGDVTEESGGIVRVFRTQIPMCADESEQNLWNAESNNGLDVPFRIYSYSNIKSGVKEANPIIYPGDVIIVEKASPIYLTGEVVQQTGVYIKEGGLSLTQALAMVGGVRPRAKTKDIKIYRLKGSGPTERDVISVNLESIKEDGAKDIMLEPYDIVEVDKSKKSIAEIAFELITGAGKTAFSAASGTLGTRVLY